MKQKKQAKTFMKINNYKFILVCYVIRERPLTSQINKPETSLTKKKNRIKT